MKFTKLICGLFLVMPFFLMSGGCGSSGSSTPAPTITLVGLTISPANTTFTVGTTFNLSAIGTFSNGGIQDLTASATWTSSNPAVATVSNTAGSKGSVTTVSAGTTTITATASGISAATLLTVTSSSSGGANVMTITVNGSLCSGATSAGYFNKPCVSVTVCNPGSTTNCQVINDVLLDTGSYGLRVFASAIPNLTLNQVPSGSGSLAGCVQFADGSSLWGPIETANVQLGSEPAVQIPIQVIDASFGTRPTQCANADAIPAAAGFTAILGVGPFAYDCGATCVNNLTSAYFSCTGANCTPTTVPLANQVQNPVAFLPQDNNGIQVQLPAVPIGGVSSINGSMLLGISTQGNNVPGSVTVLPEDANAEMRTLYPTAANSNLSFVDTGSNALYIPNSNPLVLPPCSSPLQAWYCPPVTRALMATATGANGSPSVDVPFNVSNFSQLNFNNSVFSDAAGISTFGFDWGLPFFMGKNVFFGYEGKVTPVLGTGPFVAF